MITLGGLQKTTLIDYPGKIACTVFTSGCNFRCPFCYSMELVFPEKIKEQPKIPEKDFFNFLEQRQGMLEGVVLCGGEPTIHKDIIDFARKIKKLKFAVKLDTNGSNPKVLENLIEGKLIDYVAMDIKSPKEKYEFFSGAKLLKNIKQSIEILKQNKIKYEFRTTVAPGLEKQDLLEIGNWIGGKNVNYFLQEFNSQKPVINPKILKLSCLKEPELQQIAKILEPKFQTISVR
jgi:pyruvate formate lyase activating enzyme